MKVYDGVSSIKWFYSGEKTVEQMREDPMFAGLFKEPCVLYDDGAGKVFGWEPLRALALNMCVPNVGSPESVLAACEEMIAGRAPGVSGAIASANSAVRAAGSAQTTADEAKEMASHAGADPQLQALATMQVATMDLTEATSTDCAGFRDYWPEWKPDTEYKYQQPLRHKGLYYRASKALTSSAIYPPDTAGESEYYPIEVAPDGIIVYRTCHGQYDQVQAGETRHYPDAEGPVYRAKVDTAYDPDTVPGNWELVDGEPTEPDEDETTTEPEEPSDEPTEPTIPVFVQPTGAHDAYGIGDRVHYPTADDPIYVSLIDGNVWAPDAYPQGWQLEG